MTNFRYLYWKKRTPLERNLLLLSILTIPAIIILAILFGSSLHRRCKEYPLQQDICFTPECIRISSTLLDFMDTTINPCDDFYDFACGNFMKTTNIPDDSSLVSVSTEIEEILDEQLEIIMKEHEAEFDIRPSLLVKRFYNSCMDTTAIEDTSMKDMNKFITQFGGWPVVEQNTWQEENFNWIETIHKFKHAGFKSQFLISLSIDTDSNNTNKRIISIDEAHLGLNREFLIKGVNDKLVEGYYEYMVDIAVIFGADRTRAEKELRDSLQFEINLAQITLPQGEETNPWDFYNTMSIEELQNEYNGIPWLEYINGLLTPYATITQKEIISIEVPKYLEDFETLIGETPKRVIANYLLWRIIHSSVDYLTADIRNRRLEYLTVTSGITSEIPRWMECVDIVSYRLHTAVGALYARKYFSASAKESIEDLVIDIQNEFKEILTNAEWMDENTKREAIKKLDGMKRYIGYPEEILNDTKLDKYYETLEIDSGKFLESALNISRFYNRFEILNLRTLVNETYWIYRSDVVLVDAYYYHSENSFQIPAGILQGVFFHKDRPKYMNYGGIGYLVGHEITHGFDNQGRHYGKDGNLMNWWANETENKFSRKADCIIDQYNNYSVTETDMHVNGHYTLSENIADIGGIKQAYRAYDKYIVKHGDEKVLPGLNYSGRQLFWISAGLSWCTKRRVESLKKQVITNEHAPEKFRVWGSVSNMPEFAKDFKCKVNTKMNPKKKCQLW